MEGLREHQKVHKGSLFKCEKCTKTFTMARAKKHHLCDIHGKKLNLKCQDCGHVSHTHCTLYLHLKSIPHTLYSLLTLEKLPSEPKQGSIVL